MSDTAVSIDKRLLQTLVPVNALTLAHVDTLLRDTTVEIICAGQTVFAAGEYDYKHVYLLSGSIEFSGQDGKAMSLQASDPACRFPLFQQFPRRYTVTAQQDCHVIRFDGDRLDSMLAWDQACRYIALDISSQRALDEDADWMLTLLRSNLFYKVPPINIRQILDKFTACYFSTGDMVLRQGEVGDCCYFIKEGRAGVYQAADEKSLPALVNELSVGCFFGEDALVNETVRNASIEMHTNGVLMKLDKRDFYLLLRQPKVEAMSLALAQAAVDEGAQWIDVRTQEEFDQSHIPGSLHMPLDILQLKARLLDKTKHYILYCSSGRRSDVAVYLLGLEGFHLSSLKGGYQPEPLLGLS